MLDGFALHEIICDDDGNPLNYRFLAINPAFENMTGLKAQDIIGKTVFEVMPDTEHYWIEIYGKVALTGESAFFENYSDALKKHFEVTAFRPAPNQFACIFTDITELKRSEKAMREIAQRLELATASGHLGVWDWDIQNNVMVWDDRMFELYGITKDTFSSTFDAWLNGYILRTKKWLWQNAKRPSTERKSSIRLSVCYSQMERSDISKRMD